LWPPACCLCRSTFAHQLLLSSLLLWWKAPRRPSCQPGFACRCCSSLSTGSICLLIPDAYPAEYRRADGKKNIATSKG
jgi:hypothetical protein